MRIPNVLPLIFNFNNVSLKLMALAKTVAAFGVIEFDSISR